MTQVNITSKYFDVSEKLSLYYQKWMPEDPKAILIFNHGLAEHVGRYNAFINYFSARNYGVCLYDMRGHGKSDGKRTYVGHFYDYLHDLAEFIEYIKKSSPTAPIFLVGHSFGAQIILNFIVRYAKGLRGVIALSPNIEPKLDIPNWKFKLGKLGAKWFPSIRIANGIDPALLSHDPNVVESYKNDPNVSHDITLKCGYEIIKNAELMMASASRIYLPLLLMQGGEDKICCAEATKKFYMRVPVVNKRLKIYPGLYHELLNETDRALIFADIESWLDDQLDVEYRLAGTGGRRDV